MELRSLIQRAERYAQIGEYSNARDIYKTATAEFPFDWQGWWGLCKYTVDEFSHRQELYAGLSAFKRLEKLALLNSFDFDILRTEYQNYWLKQYNNWMTIPGNLPSQYLFGNDTSRYYLPEFIQNIKNDLREMGHKNAEGINSSLKKVTGFGIVKKRKRRLEYLSSIMEYSLPLNEKLSSKSHSCELDTFCVNLALGRSIVHIHWVGDYGGYHTVYSANDSYPYVEI